MLLAEIPIEMLYVSLSKAKPMLEELMRDEPSNPDIPSLIDMVALWELEIERRLDLIPIGVLMMCYNKDLEDISLIIS